MSVVWTWIGAVTPSSARVTAEVTGSSARLAVSTNAALTAPVFFGPETPSAEGVVLLEATGLDSNTEYWYGIEDDGLVDEDWVGNFRTDPALGQASSFVIAAASCAGADNGGVPTITDDVSDHPVFDTIRNHSLNPIRWIHLGDMHYRNISTNDLSLYRNAYHDVLTYNGVSGPSARQGLLYRNIPTVYAWDDHDFGPNDSDSTHVGKTAAQQVYRERVPHYDLVESGFDPDTGAEIGAIYHSFQIARVLFVVADVRSNRSPNTDPDQPGKTMLGSAQRAWMNNLLGTSSAEFLVWVMPSQWMGLSSDSWNSFTNERSEMIQMFTDRGWIDRMCILTGDVHALAMDSGGNSPGGIPVFVFSSLDSTPTANPAQQDYDLGPPQPGRNQYGTLEIEDNGDQITITGIGWIGTSIWRSHSFTITITVPSPPAPPAQEIEVIEDFVGEASYRYIFGRIRTGAIVAEIPLFGVSMNYILNGSSDFTGTFVLDMTGFRNQDLVNATIPGQTFIVAERDGFPVWDGLVIARTYQSQAKTMQVFAMSLATYPTRVTLDDSYYPNGLIVNNQEQTSVFLDLWETLQSKPESDLGILLPAALNTGVSVSLDIQPYEHKPFFSVMSDITDGDQGFDWRIVTKKQENQYIRVMQIGYPNLGTNENNRLVFEYPGTVTNYWRTEAMSDTGTHFHGMGAGQGEEMVHLDLVHQDLIDNNYIRWDYDVELKSITDQNILNARTRQESEIRKPPRPMYVLEMRGDREPMLGTYLPGDSCTLKFEDPAHPNGFVFQTRIIGWRLTPKQGDSEEKVALYFEGREDRF